jgi:hypothetical protein
LSAWERARGRTAPFSGEEVYLVWDYFEDEVTRSTRPYEELKRLFLHERPLRPSD